MGDSDELDDLPLPPLPPGISMPPPPPPPPLAESSSEDDEVHDDIDENADTIDDALSSDFKSQWESRKANDPTLSDSKDSMYGHIDRIATGEVGTLLDRFSDRFGSELDREIIVLRKKQQQEIRAVKPTVELISAPESDNEYEDDEEIPDDVDSSDDFSQFFDVVNNLLGDMPEDFIQRFLASDSFKLFESVGANPHAADEDTRAEFFSMINAELGELPEDKINKFVESPGFELFTKMGELYGG
jgi:hypothetical protein|tara:strand:- start:282 stop:1013 length:732 start_codon:yes stop_codon:yes gene_type:complete